MPATPHSRDARRLRWFQIGLLAAIVGLGVFGNLRLSFDVDLIELLPPRLPGVAGTATLQRVFERPDRLTVALQGDGEADLEAAAESLAAALAGEPGLVRGVEWQPAWEEQGEGLVDLVAYAWWNAPAAKVEALHEGFADDRVKAGIAERVERISTSLDPVETALDANDLLGLTEALRAGIDPAAAGAFTDGGFANEAGTLRVMYVDAPSPLRGYHPAAVWLGKVRDAADRWQAAEPEGRGVRVAFTGQPAFQAEIGTGMQRDMTQSVSGITFIVGFLFWLLHRRVRPLFLLMAAMVGSIQITLGLAGILFGSLNVMSLGFAAIMMGMIEDFGVLGLNEAMERPGTSFAAVHRRIAAPVWWSAVTSAAVFAMLGFSSLPGIAQMGVLTGIGILVGAAVMLYGFLPLAMRRPCPPPPDRVFRRLTGRPLLAGRAAVVLALAAVLVLWLRGMPAVVTDSAVLRPRHCEAFDTFEACQREMLPDHGRVAWVPVVARGGGPGELAAALQAAQEVLESAGGSAGVLGHHLPLALAPDPANQRGSAPRLAELAAGRERIFRAADEAGVTEHGLALARGVFDRWQQWGGMPDPVRLPDLPALDQVIGRQLHIAGGEWTACGYVRTDKSGAAAPVLAKLEALPGVDLAGWDYLGSHLTNMLGSEARRVLAPAGVVLTILLLLVFRSWRERSAALVSLAFGGLVLLAAMSALGIGWNFVNIGAIPLCLGLGLDFHIHMIHALRHAGGPEDTHAVSRALAYCGLSTGLAFGALSFSDNAGLASFGTCSMIGVLAMLFSAAFLVPAIWWHRRAPRRAHPAS